MNKDQLEKILDLARDYFISDISIIDCYNEYAEINGLSKVYLDGGEGDIIQVFEWDSELTNKMYQAEIVFDETDAQFAAKTLDKEYTLVIGASDFCDINIYCCKVIGNIYESK